MNANSRRTILACIDGSSYHEAVVDYAAWASRGVDNPLKLLHNIERQQVAETDLSGNLGLGARESLQEQLTELEAKRSKLLKEQGRVLLTGATERALASGAPEVTALQQHGSLIDSLIDMEEEIRLLVMGIRGEDHENKDRQVGAQLEAVIRSMHRPVLVVNRPFDKAPERIMLAYDGSESARKALDMVATSPLYKGMTCHIVHVAKDAKDDSELLQEAEDRLSDADLTVVTAGLQGPVDKELRDYREEHDIDLTVMGAFGHSRLRELLFGSVTVKMLVNSRVPLLLLR